MARSKLRAVKAGRLVGRRSKQQAVTFPSVQGIPWPPNLSLSLLNCPLRLYLGPSVAQSLSPSVDIHSQSQSSSPPEHPPLLIDVFLVFTLKKHRSKARFWSLLAAPPLPGVIFRRANLFPAWLWSCFRRIVFSSKPFRDSLPLPFPFL
jgi:hypothetical protein